MRAEGDRTQRGLDALRVTLARVLEPTEAALPRESAAAHLSPDAAGITDLVEGARAGDADAFGCLYDHYQPQVFGFLRRRTGSTTVAEDLTSDTFERALRRIAGFRWQGKDFGAWLITIARNLANDHAGSSRSRLELSLGDMSSHDEATEGPEPAVMAGITHELLLGALGRLPAEQRDCLTLRFLAGLSIAETASRLARSPGAVKQLQHRGVRNLADSLPPEIAG